MRIEHSIQDFLKKINSCLYGLVSPKEVYTFSLFCLSFLIFSLSFSYVTKNERHVFVFQKEERAATLEGELSRGEISKSVYFGSKNSKVYYYSWCKAGQRVKEKNRVYFQTEKEVKDGGRTLSKLCV